MAAKIIEPAIGASTCALGNHKCVENIGSFTRNPVINRSQNMFMFRECGNITNMLDVICIENEVLNTTINSISIGKEAVIVYIIRYIPACMRSG